MDKDKIDYGVCGCTMCGIGIYDGVIVWVLKDGTKVNRFAGEGSYREQWIDSFIALQLTVDRPVPLQKVGSQVRPALPRKQAP